MEILTRIRNSLRRLQWKLTLSYSAVTVGSLLIIVFFIGYFLFSRILVPINVLNGVLSPKAWIQIVSQNVPPEWQYILSQKPVDTQLLSMLLRDDELQITFFDLFQIGDLQVRVRTTGQGSVFILDPDGLLLASSNYDLVSQTQVGKPFELNTLPQLDSVVETALAGNVDPERLFVTIEPNESFYFAIPYFNENSQEVLGVGVIYFESLPTENDIPSNVLEVLSRSAIMLLLAAGLIGTLFGYLTAKGMTRRLNQVSDVTEAWSQGDFSKFIDDPTGDEISQLVVRLNHMAEQLQQYFRRSQEMAVSEERNRLARDLHDSAKQEALAASFHLGTALTLFERDPISARNHLIEADHLVDSVRSELTDLIHELRPPSMNADEFEETLNEYIIEWAHQAGVEATLNIDGFVDLPLEIKQTIYRIMQEALANVARHSSAEMVKVTLAHSNDDVELIIQDDGSGFNTHKHYEGIGLESMRERAESVGGEFLITSAAGKGTQITAVFLINPVKE